MISACFITYNEEKNLGLCMEHLIGHVDEFVVIDGGSSDSTIAVAHKYHAKVFNHHFQNFAEHRNFAIKKAQYDWIFMIDPDERCSPKLLKILRELPFYGHEAYKVHWKNYCGNKLIVTPWKTILFKRRAHFEGDVHERITNIEDKYLIEDKEIYITHHKTREEELHHLTKYRSMILDMYLHKKDVVRIPHLIKDHNQNVRRWLGSTYDYLLITKDIVPGVK